MAGRTKKQHFVPRFYLSRFCDPDGFVWSYRAGASPRAGKPEATAVETNFYTPIGKDGERLDGAEELLARIEAEAAPIWPDLLEGREMRGEEREKMALFIAAQYLRSPALVSASAEVAGHLFHKVAQLYARNEGAHEQAIDEYEAENGKSISADERKQMREFIKDTGRYSINVSRDSGLSVLGGIDKIAGIFGHMAWTIGRSDNQHLITCDSPVARVCDPNTVHPVYGDGGFANKSVQVTFPLSPDRMLEMTWDRGGGEGLVEIPKVMAKGFNSLRASSAEKFLYSDRKDYGIQKLCDRRMGREPTSKIIMSGDTPQVKVKRKLD